LSLVKDIGIILESRELAEADCDLTLLTESGYKQRILIKGIRKSKKRPIVASELGSVIELEYYKHPGKEIYLSKEVSIRERYENLKSTYLGFLVVCAVCELTNKLTHFGEEFPLVYKLITTAFQNLSQQKIDILLLPHYKLRLLTILGLASKEFYCHSCEENIFTKNKACILEGSLDIYCGDCRMIEVSQLEVIKLLHAISHKTYTRLLTEPIPKTLILEANQILDRYILLQLAVECKSFDLLYKELQRNTQEIIDYQKNDI